MIKIKMEKKKLRTQYKGVTEEDERRERVRVSGRSKNGERGEHREGKDMK